MLQKSANINILAPFFAIFRCLTGFYMLHGNQLRIGFKNEQKVVKPHEHVNHVKLENMMKSFKISHVELF